MPGIGIPNLIPRPFMSSVFDVPGMSLTLRSPP